MNWICLIVLLASCAVECKRAANQRDSKVIATFSEDDISDKLPSPESIAAQIPKNLILKDPSNQTNIKSGKKKEKLSDSRKTTRFAKEGKRSRKKAAKESPEFSIDHKSKKMNERGSSSDDSEPEDNEITDQFIVVDAAVDPTTTARRTIAQGPAATVISAEPIQIARIYSPSKENDHESSSIPPNKARRTRVNLRRADNSSADDRICLNITLTVTTIAVIIALIS